MDDYPPPAYDTTQDGSAAAAGGSRRPQPVLPQQPVLRFPEIRMEPVPAPTKLEVDSRHGGGSETGNGSGGSARREQPHLPPPVGELGTARSGPRLGTPIAMHDGNHQPVPPPPQQRQQQVLAPQQRLGPAPAPAHQSPWMDEVRWRLQSMRRPCAQWVNDSCMGASDACAVCLCALPRGSLVTVLLHYRVCSHAPRRDGPRACMRRRRRRRPADRLGGASTVDFLLSNRARGRLRAYSAEGQRPCGGPRDAGAPAERAGEQVPQCTQFRRRPQAHPDQSMCCGCSVCVCCDVVLCVVMWCCVR